MVNALQGRTPPWRKFSFMRYGVFVLVLVMSLTALAAAAPAAPTLKGDPQAAREVQAAFEKFLAARSWRSRMTSQGTTNTTEYVSPDRFHMTMTRGAETTEMYLVARELWIKSKGSCQKLPAAVPLPNPKEIMEHSAAETTITVTRGEAETVEGAATQTYALVVESKGMTTREKLYVATATGLPRRIEVQTDRGPLVIDYFDFNTSISIASPPC